MTRSELSDNDIPPRTETWRYDPAGNLIKYTNPDGQQRNFAYDSRDRQFHSWWTGGTVNGQDIVTSYDGASRVTKVVTNDNYGTPITTVAFGYDDANRKTWEDQTLAGHPTAGMIDSEMICEFVENDGGGGSSCMTVWDAASNERSTGWRQS
jgi:hypothetical protein